MKPSSYSDTTPEKVDKAITEADYCFLEFKKKSSQQKANFLNQIASQVENMRFVLLETAQLETNLGIPRLEAELTRTVNQIREFSRLAELESWKEGGERGGSLAHL